MKKHVLENFLKFTGKHRCFPVNFAKFLRTPFVQNTSGRLLLKPLIVHLILGCCFTVNFGFFIL